MNENLPQAHQIQESIHNLECKYQQALKEDKEFSALKELISEANKLRQQLQEGCADNKDC